MGFFKKTSKTAGWMAIVFQGDALCVTHVQRVTGSKPIVMSATRYPVTTPVDAEALTKIAKLAQMERFSCTTLLSGTEYSLLSVDAPNVPAAELKVAVRWKLKDMLDYKVDDATTDVLEVPVDKNAAARNKQVYAIAARNQIIQQRQDLFAAAKVRLSVIDIQEMAQRNIAVMLESEGRGLAFLSFAADGGLLTVTSGGELFLSRRIEVTLDQLQKSSGDQRNGHFDRITLELQRSLDHFDRQYNFVPVAKLVLGPIGGVQGLVEYLASNLYVPVEALNLNDVLDFAKTPDLLAAETQATFFMALGAALRLEGKKP